MAMLLDTWMALRQRERLAVRACASVMRRVRPLEVTGMFHAPFSPDTASAGLTRPRMSSAAAVKSLAVEPGSKGSVNVDALGTPPPAAWREASASSSPEFGSRKTTSPPSACIWAIASSSPRSAISCSSASIVRATSFPATGSRVFRLGES